MEDLLSERFKSALYERKTWRCLPAPSILIRIGRCGSGVRSGSREVALLLLTLRTRQKHGPNFLECECTVIDGKFVDLASEGCTR